MEGSAVSNDALNGLAQLQEMLKDARSATPEQRAAGPPPAMMEMMRMMGAQRQEMQLSQSHTEWPESGMVDGEQAPAAPTATATPPIAAPNRSPADAASVEPVLAPVGHDGLAVSEASAPAPPVRVPAQDIAHAAASESPRWSAKTTWVMGCGGTSGLRLVICEDDATEQAEVAEARSEGLAHPSLSTLSPSDSDQADPTAATPPCDVLLDMVPAAAIVGVTVISTVDNIELFLTAPSAAREAFLRSCKCEALAPRPDPENGAELSNSQRFLARCTVKRWCKQLRLRLLGPGSSVPSVGLGRVVLRIDPSAVPPLSTSPPSGSGAHADKTTRVPSDRLDMSKVQALIGDAVLSESSRKLFDSMKRQQETGGPGGSPAGAASLQGLAGMLSMIRPPTAGQMPGPRSPPVQAIRPPAGASTVAGASASSLPLQQPSVGGMASMLAPAMAQIEATMSAMESRLTSHISAVEQRLGSRLDTIEAELGRIGRVADLRQHSGGSSPP